MSTDLSPAEQARAHRLSAQALYERNPIAFGASRYALGEIADHLDPPAPPESVESLRAERDAAVDKRERAECVIRDHIAALDAMRGQRDAALLDNKRFEGEQEELVQTLSKLSAANYTIARLRATHTEAEAAWGRFQDRPARAWKAGDPEPKGVMQVESASSGRIWTKDGTAWRNERCFMSWQHLLEDGGRITEVVR